MIFKIDYYNEGYLIPTVIYEVYNPNKKQKLDLVYCDNFQINISLPVEINESELFKYDPSNEFYNDICSTYKTENDTDIALNDRKNEYINNNLSLCEIDSNCTYNSYEYNLKKVVCKSFIKFEITFISEIINAQEKLLNNFINIKNIINLNFITCCEKLFKKEGLIKIQEVI